MLGSKVQTIYIHSRESISMRYIIEHLEDGISEWLGLEYRHCSQIVGEDILFTNVESKDKEFCKKLGQVNTRSCTEFVREALVLDPKARKLLEPQDFERYDTIVIGGILGDKVPRGRTESEITSKMKCVPRSLGHRQLSVDGAVYIAKKVEEGNRLEDLEVAYEPEIGIEPGYTVTLEYAVPVWEERAVFTPGLLEYLSKDGL